MSRRSEKLNDLAKVAYEFHQHAMAAGTEIWSWEDLPLEARTHWKQLIGTVLDYRTEHYRRSKQAG